MKTINLLTILILSAFAASGQDTNFRKSPKAIKFGLLSPIIGHTTISYENYIKPGRSYEVGVGIIGLGYNSDNASGFFIRGGYKFIQASRKSNYHLLEGYYVKPELVAGNFKERSTLERRGTAVNYGALSVNFGQQGIFADALIIDIYGGIGYGFAESERETTIKYGVLGTTAIPVFLSGGFRIGFLF